MQEQPNKSWKVEDLIFSQRAESPKVCVNYLDFTLDSKEEGNYSNLKLSSFVRFIELETFRVSSNINLEQIQDLRALHGIDPMSLMEKTIMNEMEQGNGNLILKKITELGEKSREKLFTKTQRISRKYLGYDPKETIGGWESNDAHRKLASKILKYSNLVASRCRRGPADFAILSPKLCSILMDSASFSYSNNTMLGEFDKKDIVEYMGNLANIKIFRNLYSTNDEEILIGRTTKELPGIAYFYKDPELSEEEVEDKGFPGMAKRVTLTQRKTITAIGDTPEYFYQRIIVSKKKTHNVFTHIIDLIKEKLIK
jgi:hypothetical protein